MGSVETKADSHNLMALCRSLKCPHFGSLGSPGIEQKLVETIETFVFKQIEQILVNFLQYDIRFYNKPCSQIFGYLTD